MGQYAEYETELETWPQGSVARYEPVNTHPERGDAGLSSEDGSQLPKNVLPLYNQSYVLTLRFEARESGFRNYALQRDPPYERLHRLAYVLATKPCIPTDELLTIGTTQADWEGVTFRDGGNAG